MAHARSCPSIHVTLTCCTLVLKTYLLRPYPQLQTLPSREEITDRLSLSQPQQRRKFPGPPMIVVPWPWGLEKPDWRAVSSEGGNKGMSNHLAPLTNTPALAYAGFAVLSHLAAELAAWSATGQGPCMKPKYWQRPLLGGPREINRHPLPGNTTHR